MGDMDDHQELRFEVESDKGYALSGKIMLSAIVVLFAVVVFMVGLHLYAKWYLIRLRRRQIDRRRRRRISLSELALYNFGPQPNSVPDRGLEPAVLNSLPYFLYSSRAGQTQLECAVCLSEFEEKDILRLLPKCSHSFHIECIDKWFGFHSTCPLCRTSVEHVVEPQRRVKAAQPVEKANGSEQGSSSGSGLNAACQNQEGTEGGNTTSLWGRRKGLDLAGVRIEVPPRRTLSGNEVRQNSPGSRLLSFKRIISMGRKSPVVGAPTTPRGAGTSRGDTDLDLESGISELSRVQTPA